MLVADLRLVIRKFHDDASRLLNQDIALFQQLHQADNQILLLIEVLIELIGHAVEG